VAQSILAGTVFSSLLTLQEGKPSCKNHAQAVPKVLFLEYKEC